jgi:hypothetical protein
VTEVIPRRGAAHYYLVMSGRINDFLSQHHTYLDGLLKKTTADPERLDLDAYAKFREGLLWHIGVEEKILLASAKAAQGGMPIPAASALRLHHAALASLLVMTPRRAVIDAIRKILSDHNPLEENSGGVYDQCETLIGYDSEALLSRIHSAPPVLLASYADSEISLQTARTCLKNAGFDISI